MAVTREFVNELTGEVATFEVVARKRVVSKAELDHAAHLPPSLRRMKRLIESETELVWKRVS